MKQSRFGLCFNFSPNPSKISLKLKQFGINKAVFLWSLATEIANSCRISLLSVSEFSPEALIKALNDGSFKSEAFVKRISEKVSECDDVTDVLPLIRKIIFDIIYGKSHIKIW